MKKKKLPPMALRAWANYIVRSYKFGYCWLVPDFLFEAAMLEVLNELEDFYGLPRSVDMSNTKSKYHLIINLAELAPKP